MDGPVIFSSVLAMALAALIGVSLGILGSGGSIITLPVLVYIAHVPAKEAVGMSMAIVGITSLFGALIHWRRRNVDIKAALIFSLVGMAGAFLGSTGTHLLSKQVLLLLFAGVMLIVGSLMLRGGPRLDRYRACHIPRCLIVGFVVGLLTGFLGVGGGFLIVPALDAYRRPGHANGGRNVVSCDRAEFGHRTRRTAALRSINWSLLAGFLLFAFAGMLAGLAFARRLPENLLRRLFAIALIVLAVVLALLNF